MKIEKREVVTTKEVYISVDGVAFDDQDDCLDHEYRINEAKLAFYDHNFKKSTLDKCTYVRLDTEEDVKLMLSLCEFQGITSKGIDSPGVYIYFSGRDEYWHNMTESIKRICGGAENAEN